jgi:soluble lytic murein transglycosylase-like protein
LVNAGVERARRAFDLPEASRRTVMMFLVGVGLAAPSGAAIVRERMDGAAAGKSVAAGAAAVRETAAEKERLRALTTLRYAQLFDIPMGLATEIHAAAEAEGIAPRVAFGLVRRESSFRRTAVSRVGAVGYTQLLPSTASWVAPGTKRSDLFKPQTNLRVGFRYLKKLTDMYDGDLRLALTAYNRGPGTVEKALERGQNPENGYADLVLSLPGEKLSASARRHIISETSKSKKKRASSRSKRG